MGFNTVVQTPLQAARFIVRIESAPGVAMTAKFKSCSELSAEIASSELWQGGSMIPISEPARVTYPPITLERGATGSADLFNWFAIAAAPIPGSTGVNIHKRMLDIVAQDRAFQPIVKWRVVNAYPVGYKAGEWENDSDDFLMESITLKFDFFRPVGLPGINLEADMQHVATLLP